jgi:hypothetical protein
VGQAVTAIIDQLPAVVEIDERIKRLREQERRIVEKSSKRRQQYQRDRARWEQQALADELDGKSAKPPPKPPDDTVRNIVLGQIRSEIEQALRARRAAIVDAEPEIRDKVEQETSDLIARAVQPVADLREVVGQVRNVVRALDDLADARQGNDPMRTTPQRRPPVVDVDALVHAVDHGIEAVLAGRDPRIPRELGMQPGSTLHEPTAETPEPSSGKGVTTGPAVTSIRTNRGAEL